MPNPTVISSSVEKPRQKLYRQYRRLKSWQKLAAARQTNVSYVYDYVVHGIVPANRSIQRKLGIPQPKPVTINQLLNLPIQDMPHQILRLALENREVMA
jgi:hypothetical protein